MNRATMLHHQAHLMAGQVYDGHELSDEEYREIRAAHMYLVAAMNYGPPYNKFSELAADVHMRVYNGSK